MMRPLPIEIDRRAWFVSAALVLNLLVLSSQVNAALATIRCMERAQTEAIICIAPPPDWQIALSGAIALALAIGLGALIGAGRRPADRLG